MDERESGIVECFDRTKGYGFIQRDKDGDLFVHYGETRGVGFRSLVDEQRVEFSVVEGI